MKYQTFIIGHVTMDENVDYDGKTVFTEGGAVLYSSAAAYGTGHKTAALTALNEKDKGRIEAFRLPEKDVFCVFKDKSTDMYNRYLTVDRERRDSRCASRGTPFTAEDFADLPESEIYHLAGLLCGDYDENLIPFLSTKGKVAVDVQGYLRHAASDGKMYFEDWQEKEKYLPYIDYLKTDAAEAEILTGATDRKKAAFLLCEKGAKEVLITHNSEVVACDGKNFCSCPIKAESLVGRTGRGDTAFAVYVTERQDKSMEEALLFSTAAVSLKMATVGPFKGERKDVEEYVKTHYTGVEL